MQIKRRAWGEGIWLFDIESDDMRVSVSDFGGFIQKIEIADPCGKRLDAVLGYDSLEDYRHSDTFFGAMIGPIADRLAGGRCVLDGREVQLPLNAGPDAMHCSDKGFHRAIWNWETIEDGLRLYRTFEEAERGFPGDLTVDMRYRLPGPGTLRLEYAATCTRQTAVSITNHSYFNLTGGLRDCLEHRLTLRAERYAETTRDSDPICTGRVLPVDGTPLDLRGGAALGDAVSRNGFREIAAAGGIDHYFPVGGEGLREFAKLINPGNGLTMTCRSDAPGLLVYTANGLGPQTGKSGATYGRNWGVCLETGRFPNAVNLADWRDQVLLLPGQEYRSITEFEFRWS